MANIDDSFEYGFENADGILAEENIKNAKYDWFKANDEPKVIRFIALPDDNNTILSYGEHFVTFLNGWTRGFSCPDYKRNLEVPTCIICQTKSGKNGEVKDTNFTKRFLMNVIERDAKDPDEKGVVPATGVDKLKVYKFGLPLYNIISGLNKEYGTIGDRDYKVSMHRHARKNGIYFILEPLTKKPVPLSKTDLEIIANKPLLVNTKPTYDEGLFVTFRDKVAETSSKSGNGQSEVINVKDTINEFLNSTNDDILASLPVVTDTDDEVDEGTPEFFANLRKHKGKGI